MSNPFQDQFLKLGLVDKKQVSKTKKNQHQKKKQQAVKKGATVVDENTLLAQQERDKRRARDLELNRQREEKLRKREVVGAIRQMVTQNQLEKDKNGVAYRFTDGKKIQRIFVSQELAGHLSSGKIGVVRLGEEYQVIPRTILEKVVELDASLFCYIAEAQKEEDDADDPYADYKVPDDLMW